MSKTIYRYWWLGVPVLFLGLWLLFARGLTADKTIVHERPMLTDKYQPVVYDVDNWQTTTKRKPPFSQWLTLLGNSQGSEQALDIGGNHGTLYRYHRPDEPFFYAIDSPNFIEINWYFAAPSDSAQDKQQSIDYAKKAYALAGAWVGQKSMALFKILLQDSAADTLQNEQSQNEKAPSEALPSKNIALPEPIIKAQCQNHRCQLVFKKSPAG